VHAPEITVERVIQGRILSCGPELPVAEAAKRMAAGRCSCIVVMDGGDITGIWTERDALDIDVTRPETLAVPIGTVMRSPVKTIEGTATLGEATIRFKREGVRHLVVTGAGGAAAGIVTQTDVILNRGIQHYLSLRSVRNARSRDVTAVGAGTGVAAAARLMKRRGIDALVVTYDDGEHGILTERDIVRHLSRRTGDAPVGTVASRPLVCVDNERSLYSAKSLLAEKRIRHLGVTDESGALVGLLSFTDILGAIEHGYAEELSAMLREKNAELAQSREREALVGRVFEATLEPILITDAKGLIVSVNPAFTRLTGYESADIVGRSTRILNSGRHDRAFYDAMWRELETAGLWRGEMWDRKKSGEVFLSWTTITGIRNAEGRFTNYAALYGDIASSDQQAGRMLHRWTHDGLTGLPNRCQLIETLGPAVQRARAAGHTPAVAVIGLDRFRALNDTFGMTIGDEILRVAAHRIRECVPANGMAARLVGDEFALFLPDAEEQKALHALAGTLLEALSKPATIDGLEIYVTASMGISVQHGSEPADSETMLKTAGCALHEAKQAGRNIFRLSSNQIERRTRSNFTIETDLHHALERDELRLHYQPKIDLESMAVVGMEALVRWQHPTRGLVPPDEFITVAEECGLIVPIGSWVLETACAQTRAWIDQGLGNLQVAVNISAWQFRSDLFEKQVQRSMERTGLAPCNLELELTESIAVDDTGKPVRTMQALREMGVALAIDDFGTGYSSLSYVQRLPVTTVKIDRSFIKELDLQATGSAIPRAIITMAHHLGLKVVAEGIETYTHLDMLQFDGCDQGQGYYFSKPLSTADFAAFCRSPRTAERAHCL
jgi:diguanylate cyclase (GGDEF)-like protein/PAS domain S-box-containing protein